MTRHKRYKKIAPLLFLFITLWISIQIFFVYHLGWVNFKNNFMSAIRKHDIVLFKNVENSEPLPKIILVSIKGHTIIFQDNNVRTTTGIETIRWSSHYSWEKFNPEKVTIKIIK